MASPSSAYRVVVLGDSYSAGNGAGKYGGAKGCYRSKNNYGNLYGRYLAKKHHYKVSVTTEACSGAVTADYWNSKAGRRPQRDALSQSTDLVLMTFGGNDLGFADIVTQCLVGATDDEQKCAGYLSLASGMIANGTLSSHLRSLLQDVANQTRTDTKIVLVGYPYLEIDRNLKLGSIALGERLYALSDAGERAQSDVVAELNAASGTDQFRFVSTKALFEGLTPWLPKADQHRHELYKAKKNKYRWMVHPLWDASIKTKATYYHPNPKGWSHEAQLLAQKRAAERVQMVTVNPFDASGTLKPDYRIEELAFESGATLDCSLNDPSPAGVTSDTHWCAGLASDGGAFCWADPTTPDSALCLYDAESTTLDRYPATGLDSTPAAEDPQPMKVELVDGTQWTYRTGGAWYPGPDDMYGTYACVCKCSGEHALVAGDNRPTFVKSNGVWKARVGQLGPDPDRLPSPRLVQVSRVWFIAAH